MKLFWVFNYRRSINRIVTLRPIDADYSLPIPNGALVLLISEPDFKKEIHNIYTFQTLAKRTRLENRFLSGDNY